MTRETETAETISAQTQVEAPAARRLRGSKAFKAVDGSAATEAAMQSPTQRMGSGITTPASSSALGKSIETQATTASTPIEAMFFEELERTRLFLKLMLILVAGLIVTLPFLGGHPVFHKVVTVGVVGSGITLLLLLWKFRNPRNFTLGWFVAGGVALAVCAFTGVLYFGIYSPAPALIILGIYFYSLGAQVGATIVVYLLCAALQGGAALFVALDVMPDVGLVRADMLSPVEQILIQVIVQILYFCAYMIARLSRNITIGAVSRLEAAVRQVSQREALLREARQDLDRALRVGGAGRYSEQTIGSYRLGALIGRGGMGEVYEAFHRDSGEVAAIKLLSHESLANPDQVTRFFREIRAAAAFEADHIVKVLEVGSTAGDIPYLAMERLEGQDLAHHLRKRRRLSVSDVISLVDQVGKGLSAAREAGIVHRDIKPQNLFLAKLASGGRTWKILDFGVSKLAEHHGTLTKGHVVGTPGYMAPEQARGEDVDYRADMYALAAIAYRSLTGQPPFSGKDVPTTLYEVVYSMPARPSLLAELNEDIDLVLAIGMAKKPAKRFTSGEHMARALGDARRGMLDEQLRQRAYAILDDSPWRGAVGRV